MIVANIKKHDFPESSGHIHSLGPDGLRIIYNFGKKKNDEYIDLSSSALNVFLEDHLSLLKHKQQSIKILVNCLLNPEIAVPAIPKATDLLHNSSEASNYDLESCLEALATFGPKAKVSVPLLMKILTQPDSESILHKSAMKTLASIGSSAKVALPVLMAKFQPDKNIETPDDALAAIGQAAVPKVRPFLQHGLVEMRLRAVKILGRIGPDASAASEQIRDRLITVRAAAAEALGRIETKKSPDKRSIEKLHAARKDSSLTVRLAAEKALRQLGQAVPTNQ